MGRTGQVDRRKKEEGRRRCRSIARDISESAYSGEDVCVCVCVCVTYILYDFYATTSPLPTSYVSPLLSFLPDIRQLQYLPCYTPTPSTTLVRCPSASPSYPSRSSQDLATPGREQCHHRPIHQLWLLPNARPFVARAAEEQAVRHCYWIRSRTKPHISEYSRFSL